MVSARKGRLQFVSSLLPGQTSPLWGKKSHFEPVLLELLVLFVLTTY